jgi:hypothetical protein
VFGASSISAGIKAQTTNGSAMLICPETIISSGTP